MNRRANIIGVWVLPGLVVAGLEKRGRPLGREHLEGDELSRLIRGATGTNGDEPSAAS